MSEFKIDLEQLKKSVEERKNNSMVVEQAMGRTGIPKTDKRTFLANLLSSVNVGDKNNTAVQALQTLNETVESTRGVPTAVAKNISGGRSGDVYTPTTSLTNYKDNDAAFEREIQKRAEDMIRMNKMGQSNNTPLSEAVNSYAKTPYVGQPMNEQYVPQTQQYGGSAINEQIQRTVADVMSSSMFDKMINESFRNVITEIYTKEKIETVIKEYVDSDLFKKIVATKVADTIKQLQEIQKKKAGNV